MNNEETVQLLDKFVDDGIGGGAAGALSGAVAANILRMVASLSLKKDYGLTDAEYIEIAGKADCLEKKLKEGVFKDNSGYLLMRNAYSLPKNTPEEQQRRSQAIRQAAYQASLIPYENAVGCSKVLQLAQLLDGKSNTSTQSDLNCALRLSWVGLQVCIENIRVNFPSIWDQDKIDDLSIKAESLERLL